MKKVKTLTCLISAMAMLAAVVSYPATATVVNDCSIDYYTLTNAIVTDSGDTIPAGSVAVTLSIENNAGFSDNTFLLNIEEGYKVILGNDNKPIVDTDDVLDDFIVASAVNGNRLCVAVASAETSDADGDMFTFYCRTDGISDNVPATIGALNTAKNHTLEVNRTYYYFGDVKRDFEINSTDAACILNAISINGGAAIDIGMVHYNNMAWVFFPTCYELNPNCYFCADVIPEYNNILSDYITNEDASAILSYSAWANASPVEVDPHDYPGTGRFGVYDAN